MNSHQSRQLRQQKLLANRFIPQRDAKAKPGTIDSLQKVQNVKLNPGKKSKHMIANERLKKIEYLDTNLIVDESIILFKVELGLMKQLQLSEIPESPNEFCRKFTVVLNYMDL